jgi:hypothetical protein
MNAIHTPVFRRHTRALARGVALAAAFASVSSVGAGRAAAQAHYYPSFQVPRVTDRDYTGALIANAGTGALFQWREGIAANAQLSLDAGLADLDDAGTRVFFGGNYARELTRSTAEQPLDLLFTLGAGLSLGDGPELFRIPVGLSLGHRFPLEGSVAITPYVHPRLSLDVVTGNGGGDGTDLTIDFDLGASFEITPQLAIRASLLLTGADLADGAGFGLGLTYRPAALRR